MRILVTGSTGMLGRTLCATLADRGHSVTATSRAVLDVADPEACGRAVTAEHDAVVNASAWTGVDAAEEDEGEAFAVNAVGAANLARACHRASTRFVQVSTDYVFDGRGSAPYPEDTPLAPISAYGRTKAAGEWAARADHDDTLVVRTAWLYGPGGKNFVGTIARLARERETLDVVTDQRGQPTPTRDVAAFIADLLEAGAPPGAYHATTEGETTWFGLAQAIFEELGLDPGRVHPTDSATLALAAPRPAYSVLGHARTQELGLPLLPQWRKALAETIADVVPGPVPTR